MAILHSSADFPLEHYIEDEDVDLTLINEGDTLCKNCSLPVTEYPEGWTHDDDDNPYCYSMCEDDFDDEQEEEEADRAEPAPRSAVNWVGATLDNSKGEASVQISVSDPRGCFYMRVFEAKNPETGEPELRLSVPYEGDPHVKLERISESQFRIIEGA